MSQPSEFAIDVEAEFPHLPNAPIVEAVIHWQAVPSNVLERAELKEQLEKRFPEYSIRAQHRIEAGMSGSADGIEMRQRTQWGGFRLTSADEKHVCQLKPNAVLFSRLAPYEKWPPFVAEAVRFWQTFVGLAAPVAIQRMGVRFISQMDLKDERDVLDLVEEAPAPLQSIGLLPETFFRQDTVVTPDRAYVVHLRRAIQEAEPPLLPTRSLLLDIDVFTTDECSLDKAAMDRRLEEMRFIKNKIFFSFVKDAKVRFGEH